MKERPILFSSPMVKAILDGRKSMTRRIGGLDKINENPDKWEFIKILDAGNVGCALFQHKIDYSKSPVNYTPSWREWKGKNGGAPPVAIIEFMQLWESINGPGSWADNHFVWVIEFRRVE